ncbi:MAG: hypothetical protein CSA83_02810, partial [Actinomycetales bacterium]
MTQSQWIELGLALGFGFIAVWLTATESAISSITRSRADWMVENDRPGAKRILLIAQDPAPYLNTTIFVRTLTEIASVVLAAVLIFDFFKADWEKVLATAVIMV